MSKAPRRRLCWKQLQTQITWHFRGGRTGPERTRGAAAGGWVTAQQRFVLFSLLSMCPQFSTAKSLKRSHLTSFLKEKYNAGLACSSSNFVCVQRTHVHVCACVQVTQVHVCASDIYARVLVCASDICMQPRECVQVTPACVFK